MKKAILNGLLATAFLSPFAFAEDAEAREYCREYTKRIHVNGHWETGYGTACQQPDGAWLITSASGTVDPFEPLRSRRDAIIVADAPVYYTYGPSLQPITYYAPRYYRPSPGFSIGFYSGHNRGWQNHRRWDRDWDRHDNDHDGHRGRGRH